MSTRRMVWVVAMVAIVGLGAAVAWLAGDRRQDSEIAISGSATLPGPVPGAALSSGALTAGSANSGNSASPLASNPRWDALRQELRAKYEKVLAIPGQRLRFVTELLRFMESEAGGFDEELARAFLTDLFPGQVDGLLDTLKGFVAYRDWMESERELLATLGAEERSQRIWDKRRELFGADAEQIWIAEVRSAQVLERMTVIDQQPGTVATKAALYADALRETYGEQSARMMENHRQELTDRFVALPSVQAQLASLPVLERRQAMRDMRSTLGMDEAALERWDELDQTRDGRWEAGQAYQAAREALPATLPADEREKAMQELRRQYLGDEADTVAGEEQAGYYRFKEPRVFGIN